MSGARRISVHRGARMMLAAAGVPVEIVGGEILQHRTRTGPWIFAPNHSSYLDVLVMLAFMPPDVRYVAKGEIRDMPFMGTLAGRSGHFAFDRSDPQARIRQAEEVNAALRKGESVVIFPEGTFTAAAGIRPFQLGAFKAAVDTQRPICAVSVRGARANFARQDDIAAARTCDVDVQSADCARSGGGKRLA